MIGPYRQPSGFGTILPERPSAMFRPKFDPLPEATLPCR
jgi:hypothetical protein